MKKPLIIVSALLVTVLPSAAMAYVGPGAGISLLGALWGLVAGVVLAIGTILIWPVRILLRKRKARRDAEAGDASEGSPASASRDEQQEESHAA